LSPFQSQCLVRPRKITQNETPALAGGHVPEDLDLIITDVHMPVVDGLEVFWALRAAHWTVPVIVVMGHDAPEIRDAAARLGAILLPKPVDLGVLESSVRKLLSRSAATNGTSTH
jgi:DNA-binding response OmpR family regulator